MYLVVVLLVEKGSDWRVMGYLFSCISASADVGLESLADHRIELLNDRHLHDTEDPKETSKVFEALERVMRGRNGAWSCCHAIGVALKHGFRFHGEGRKTDSIERTRA